MSTFCIKTNDSLFINHFSNNIDILKKNINVNDILIRKKQFSIYTNLIIHYKGNDINTFYEELSKYITDCIITVYENTIIQKIINMNYFYFLDNEQLEVFRLTKELINSDEKNRRHELIYISTFDYISNNKSMILDGFITFRLKDYMEIIDYIIDLAVNNFLVKREYFEFVDLLKQYISTKTSACESVHLIYLNNESILLDSNYNIINTSQDFSDINDLLLDIEFSSNDYSLNALLNLLPKKIYIHLLSNEDEFIDTLKLIFENRIYFCKNPSKCEICNFYKKSNIKI